MATITNRIIKIKVIKGVESVTIEAGLKADWIQAVFNPPVAFKTALTKTLEDRTIQSAKKMDMLAPRKARPIRGSRCFNSISSKPKVEADMK